MFRYLIFAFFHIIIASELSGQRIEVLGGLNRNTIFTRYDDPHTTYKFYQGRGVNFGIALDSIIKGKMQYRITFHYENYCGGVDRSEIFLGGATDLNSRFTKSIVSFGFFPLNFRFHKIIETNLGIEFSRLQAETVTGAYSQWTWSKPKDTQNLDQVGRFNSKSYLGIRARIALDLRVWKSLNIVPQYLFYFGSEEFEMYQLKGKSVRHSICLGIKRRLRN